MHGPGFITPHTPGGLLLWFKFEQEHFGAVFVPQPSGDAVSLLENIALISEGTTGLVTWEAALYLAEWALDHRQVFSGRYHVLVQNEHI